MVDGDCADMNTCDQDDPPSWQQFVCSEGNCVAGMQQVCDDGNVCTQNTCTPATGCAFPPVTDCRLGPGSTCCLPGWSCQIADGTCACTLGGRVCPDGSCRQCCELQDCISDGLGDALCSACQNGGCVAINEGEACDLGGGFFGECILGFCNVVST
jgi:hypothetical protein